MTKYLAGLKPLSGLLAPDQLPDLEKTEREIERIVSVVDRFYALLGERNWIFHDHLNLAAIEELVDQPAERAEADLIAYYRDPENLSFQIGMLNRFPELQARRGLIERARADYEAERYYATTLVLIAVMDGFVNDIEADRRRGLHAREADELVAWDSVVGHHMGLTNAHRTFTKTFRKRSDEEVHELYRNGIVHGMLTSFDNVVVATKAWNRLFAVADWARAQEEEAKEPEPEPDLEDLLKQFRDNEENRKELGKWKPRTLAPSDQAFEADEVYQATASYLEAWQRENFGEMAKLLSHLTRRGQTDRQAAGMIRDQYSLVRLSGFEITKLDHQGAAACEADVLLTAEGDQRPGRMRWIREDGSGEAAMPHRDGHWGLVSWGPFAIFDRADD